MLLPFQLSQAIQSMGVAQIFVNDLPTAVVTVDTAGAAKAATAIPIKALPVALPSGFVLSFQPSNVLAVLTAAAVAGATSLTVAALPGAVTNTDLATTWENIGAVEGDVQETGGWTMNDLTAPQMTGGAVHQTTAVIAGKTITVPIIGGTQRTMQLLSPTGSEDGVNDTPTPPVEKAMFLIPRSELLTGMSYAGSTWSPAAPVNSVYFPRCYISGGPIPRPYANGGKAIIQATITPMYYAAGPAGKRLWVRGDPVAKGYPNTLRF